VKKIIIIVVCVIVVIFVGMAIFGYFLEKKEVEEVTPRFEEMYKEVLLVLKDDRERGIEELEDAMYYGHSHSLAAYQDPLITGYNEYYREGLNILAEYYLEQGKKLADEGNLQGALKIYEKIYDFTDKDESIAYKKGQDVDLLFMEIKKLKRKIK
jgi:tetratricopeptide (TPR) repeat protein